MENIVIIGDNKKILENNIDNFIEKIKVIYIDPPYNTKRVKSYEDKKDNWLEEISNTISLSKKFLCKAGVIFISIDDNEFANLKISCDKIFGSENFLGSFITNQAKRSNSKFINITHEYILAYAKNKKYKS
ncbi:MAG: DNA methyltransferase, partial [Campylobacter sp.]|nr:DNA methyltransferase [Campylobacter sp.]